MARVYSQSQGKFIDKPDATPGAGATAGATGGDESQVKKLKQFYALQLLQRAKNASDITAAFKLMEPSAAEMKAMDKKKELEVEKSNKAKNIEQAISLLKGDAKTGRKAVKTNPVAASLMKVKSLWGGGTPDEQDLYRLLAEIGGTKMFEVGGKALTAPERQILSPIIPSSRYSTNTNISNLRAMQEKLGGLYAPYEQAAGQVMPDATAGYDTQDYTTPGFIED